MSENSGESIDAILNQIKEYTQRTDFSSNDFPSDVVEPLIDDISVTSSLSEMKMTQESEDTNFGLEPSSVEVMELSSSGPAITESEFNADVSFFLMQISKFADCEVSSLDDAAKLFKQLKYGNQEENAETVLFIEKFNDRFNVAADSLEDVLDLMEVIQCTYTKPSVKETVTPVIKDDSSRERLAALELHNRKLADENGSLRCELEELKQLLEEQQSKSNLARLDAYKDEEKSSSLEHNLRKSEAQVKSLKRQLDVLTEAKSNAEKAYNGLEELLRTQINETSNLAQQRDQLVSLLRKQNEVCQRYDDQNVTEKPTIVEKPIETVKFVEKIVKQDNIELLVKVCQRVSEKLPSHILQEIIKIRDSGAPADNRIIGIVNCICDYQQLLQCHLDRQKSETKTVDEQVRYANEACDRVLRVFENELRFMQRLVSSSDLQNVVFYRPKVESSLVLDADARNELIRHTVLVAKFIEENIGSCSREQIAEMACGIDEVNSDGIFDLMESKCFGERVSELLDTLAMSETQEARTTYDLFFAQAIMSEIMKKHVESLQSQVVYANHEIQKMKADLDNQDAMNSAMKDANKMIRKLQRREKKLTKELNKLTNVRAEKEDLFTVVGQLETEIAGRDKEIARLSEDVDDKTEQLDGLNKHLEQIMEQHKAAVKHHKREVQEIKRECDMKQKDAAAAERMHQDQRREWMSALSLMRDNVRKLRSEKDDLVKLMQLLQQSHKLEVDTFVQHVEKFDRQLKVIERDFAAEKKQKAELVARNSDLNDSVTAITDKLKQDTDSWRSRLAGLQSQYESSRQECGKLRAANDQLSIDNEELETALQESRCELETQKIQQRSMEIKLKTEAERFENEKRTLSSQLMAKLTAYRNEFTEQLDQAERYRAEQMNEMVEICQNHLNNGIDLTNPVAIARVLEETIAKLESDKKQYIDIIDDFTNAQAALGISPSMSLTCAVRKLQDDLRTLQADCESERASTQSLTAQLEKHKRDAQLSRTETKASQQWETWAKRMHSIMSDSRCAALTGEQLRACLEEGLMASIAHRSMLFKMSLLKDEKKALIKFNKDLMMERSFVQGSWRALIVVCSAVKRMQQRAGCVPLTIGSGRMDTRRRGQKQHGKTRPIVPIV